RRPGPRIPVNPRRRVSLRQMGISTPRGRRPPVMRSQSECRGTNPVRSHEDWGFHVLFLAVPRRGFAGHGPCLDVAAEMGLDASKILFDELQEYVHAKTYSGGGLWSTLELDRGWIAVIPR